MMNTIRRSACRTLLGLLALLPLGATARAADYLLIDLGANVAPHDINNLGEVAGARNTDQYPSVAFVWSPETGFSDLDGTVSYAINDAGTVVGATVTGAFVLEDGRLRSWDDQGAYGLSENGLAAGNAAGRNPYRTTSIPYNPAVLEGSKWTVMDIAQVYPRGTRPGVYADQYVLYDINDAGYAVGRKSRYGLVGSSALLIEPPYSSVRSAADVVFLSIPAGGSAAAINESNRIVGTTGNSSTTGDTAFAFLYDAGDVTNLGTLGGLRSGAADINEFDQVVGWSDADGGRRAFVWDAGNGMRDLNALAAADGWVLESAVAINDAGEIVGTGTLDGQPHGFLLALGATPPPQNRPPIASISTDVAGGKAPLEVQFTGSGSSDPDGVVAGYQWDFGDGASSTDADPVHVYTDPGDYLCVLTVTDDGGLTATAQVDIAVQKGRGKPRK